MGTGSFSG